MRKIRFYVNKDKSSFVKKIIQKTSFANQNNFRFYRTFKQNWTGPVEWENFDLEDDFMRQNIRFKKPDKSSNILVRPKKNSLTERMLRCNGVVYRETEADNEKTLFRLVDNSSFAFCQSYMRRFLVPRILSNVQLAQVCKFRSKGRIPILCFAYQDPASKNGLIADPQSPKSYLWRGAQLKSGVLNRRSVEDEFFVSLMHDPLKFNVVPRITEGFPAIQRIHQFVEQLSLSKAVQRDQTQSSANLGKKR